MTSQNILYIEASKADYKEQLEEKKPRSWLKSVSAFANTHGGHLIFGVKNEPRTVAGLADPQAVIGKATELIKARIDPAPRYMVRVVEIEGKVCVDLEVQNGPAYPYYYAADGVRVAYVRHGDQSVEATARELNELILKGMNQTFDALPSPYRVGDVSFTLLAATFKNLRHEEFDLAKELPSAGLVTLADWLGSDEHFFPPDTLLDEDSLAAAPAIWAPLKNPLVFLRSTFRNAAITSLQHSRPHRKPRTTENTNP